MPFPVGYALSLLTVPWDLVERGKQKWPLGPSPGQDCNLTHNISVDKKECERKINCSNPADVKSPEESIPGRSEMQDFLRQV